MIPSAKFRQRIMPYKLLYCMALVPKSTSHKYQSLLLGISSHNFRVFNILSLFLLHIPDTLYSKLFSLLRNSHQILADSHLVISQALKQQVNLFLLILDHLDSNKDLFKCPECLVRDLFSFIKIHYFDYWIRLASCYTHLSFYALSCLKILFFYQIFLFRSS